MSTRDNYPEIFRNLQDELKLIQKRFKMTIVFVTHSFYEAVYLGDRLMILSGEKPTNFIYDHKRVIEYKNRFDPKYLEKIQEVSTYFLGPERSYETR